MAHNIVDEQTTDVTREVVSNNPEGSVWSRAFWKGAGERALKTFGQAAGGALIVAGVSLAADGSGESAWTLNWVHILGVGLVGAVLSLFQSLGNVQFVSGSHEVQVERRTVTAVKPVVPVGDSAPAQQAPHVEVYAAPGVETTRVAELVDRGLRGRPAHRELDPAPDVQAEDPVAQLQAELDAAVDAEGHTP